MSGEKNTYVPPVTNRGVQSTVETGLRACVDWVQATLKNFSVEQLITDVLKLDFKDFVPQDNGAFGYKKSLCYGRIVVYYDGNPDMGVHFKLSGQACREYEECAVQTWGKLFAEVLGNGGHLTRLDVAIDDFAGYFKISTVLSKIKKGELVSKFKSAKSIEGIKIEDGASKGRTVYFGSEKSVIQIRMYDKRLERIQKGKTVEVDFWNRTEVQCRDQRADRMAWLIAEAGSDVLPDGGSDETRSVGVIVKGILANYLRFLVKPSDKGDKNKSRWKTAPFWNKFLGDVEKISLSNIAPDRTLEDTIDWVNHQVSKSLGMIYSAYGDDPTLILEIMKKGVDKIGKKERAILNRFYNSKPDVIKTVIDKKRNRINEEETERIKQERYDKMFMKLYDLIDENDELKRLLAEQKAEKKPLGEATPYDFM